VAGHLLLGDGPIAPVRVLAAPGGNGGARGGRVAAVPGDPAQEDGHAPGAFVDVPVLLGGRNLVKILGG
jgi:hypothetical protein